MHIPSLIGFLFAGIAMAVFIWGGHFSEYDITQPAYLYRAIFAGFVSGLLGYLWGRYFITTFYKEVELRLIEMVDNMVVKAPEVSEYDLKKIVSKHDAAEDSDFENEYDLTDMND